MRPSWRPNASVHIHDSPHRDRRRLHDAADHDAIGEDVEIVFVPYAGWAGTRTLATERTGRKRVLSADTLVKGTPFALREVASGTITFPRVPVARYPSSD